MDWCNLFGLTLFADTIHYHPHKEMNNLSQKLSGVQGLSGKAKSLALAAMMTLALKEGQALGQGVQPNDVGVPNPKHALTVYLYGMNLYSNVWNGQVLPKGAPFGHVWKFNPDRFTDDPYGGWDDMEGTITFSTSQTNSVTHEGIFFVVDNSYESIYNFTNNFIECGDLVDVIYGAAIPSQTLADTDFATGFRALNNFSFANLDSGTINGPPGINGGQLRANVTNVVVNVAGQPIASILRTGNSTLLSYSMTNALPVYTPYFVTSLLSAWKQATNAVATTNHDVITWTISDPQPSGQPNVVPTPPSAAFYSLR
jgi:hypothetical protein